MPGRPPQTQHKGTVCGDEENAPKPGLGPPVRRLLTYFRRRLRVTEDADGNGYGVIDRRVEGWSPEAATQSER